MTHQHAQLVATIECLTAQRPMLQAADLWVLRNEGGRLLLDALDGGSTWPDGPPILLLRGEPVPWCLVDSGLPVVLTTLWCEQSHGFVWLHLPQARPPMQHA